MKQGLLVLCFLVVGLITVFAGLYIWQMLGPISLSIHGWLAIIAGVVGSFLLGGGLMALTPISAFRPRRWRGALLPDESKVILNVLEHEFRPVSASADSAEIRHVNRVVVEQANDITLNLLYDPGFSLSERATREQFLT